MSSGKLSREDLAASASLICATGGVSVGSPGYQSLTAAIFALDRIERLGSTGCIAVGKPVPLHAGHLCSIGFTDGFLI